MARWVASFHAAARSLSSAISLALVQISYLAVLAVGGVLVQRGTMSVASNMGSMLAPAQGGADAAALERMMASAERLALRPQVRELAALFAGTVSHIDYEVDTCETGGVR